MEVTPEILEKLQLLHQKYKAMGQDMSSYLDGLLYADVTTYWDYIQTDTLLTLQKPKTKFPDEEIFIMYHQITELYFKLSIHELKQICFGPDVTLQFLTERVKRINRYFEALTKSFEVMINGMEVEQFLKFRMSLLPASGFQSAQYRMIEIYCTDMINLTDRLVRDKLRSANVTLEELFANIYWKKGATELATGEKTLTLKQFEAKYTDELLELAHKVRDCNLLRRFEELSKNNSDKEAAVLALKELDNNVNVNWPLVHLKSAARYLQKDPEDIRATGGTNWQKYLPPRFQQRIFFPLLFSSEELNNRGRNQ
jgi:tryptophan 2,3-dioxygenase